MIKKVLYMLKHGFNPYPFYWFDLLTERHLKNRVGECENCIECCRYLCNCKISNGGSCYCKNVDLKSKRCKIYNNRTCNIWFPISQKEIDNRKRFDPNFKCKFSFK